MNRISVIIPNYNRAALIGATIENMLKQTLPPDEVIVVDDGSTDNSLNVIRSFGDRIHLIEQTNQGPGAARNRGLDAASGDYIQFMDSDDLVSLNKLEIQSLALQQSNADFAYCPWIRSIIQGNQIQFSGLVMQGSPLPDWKSMLEWHMGSWCLVFQNCLFRRKSLETAGKYRTDLMIAEDGEYLVRILLEGAVPTYTGNCIVFYRTESIGQNQITSLGTPERQRAQDRTHYLEIVSEQIDQQLDNFHRSTRREIALDTYRHNRYCQKMDWPGVDPQSCFSHLMASMPPGYLWLCDKWERLRRKLAAVSAVTPYNYGLMLRKINTAEKELAAQAGFDVQKHTSQHMLSL
jgi:glycosyltransferase involved in cell wall biosynthesis